MQRRNDGSGACAPRSAGRRAPGRRGARAAALLAAVALVACPGGAGPADADAASERAARRGVAWLLAQRDAMSAAGWASPLARVYRATADPALADAMATVVREALAAEPLRCTHTDPDDPAYQDGSVALWALLDLLRCREAGRDLTAARRTLAIALAADRPVWRQSDGHRLVLAHLLERLEIGTGPSVAELREAIRARCRAALSPQRRRPCELYALTHIILVDSDYWQRYLDAADYPLEVRLFREAVRQFRRAETDDLRADIVSEILACYKLLRLPLDEDARALRDRIVSLQNDDGSWGRRVGPELRAHLTALATLALLEYAPELRTGFALL